jgi:hypothetical protein
MRTKHFFSLDVHCEFSEMAVATRSGRLTKRHRCATAIPPLVEAIGGVARPRYATFEKGPLADWLYRHLLSHANQALVCGPRRNHLNAKDSDEDDSIGAERPTPSPSWRLSEACSSNGAHRAIDFQAAHRVAP